MKLFNRDPSLHALQKIDGDVERYQAMKTLGDLAIETRQHDADVKLIEAQQEALIEGIEANEVIAVDFRAKEIILPPRNTQEQVS
jgi:hypothetical protein